jgi:hypothetical protein
MCFGFSQLEGPADKSLLLTIKLEFVRILPAAGRQNLYIRFCNAL